MNLNAQRIKLIEGDLLVLQAEDKINTEFTYDNMKVGKFAKEADYVADKTQSLNKKEPGKGDTWAKAWVTDRHDRFEPKFNEMLQANSTMTISRDAKCTVIFKTLRTEPSFNVGLASKTLRSTANFGLSKRPTMAM